MKAANDDQPKYAKLTEQQKRQWHAEVYAFRRVVLDVPNHEHTSPCDPKGEWYHEQSAAGAERKLRRKIAEQRDRCADSTRNANAIRYADGDAERDWQRRRLQPAAETGGAK